MSQVEVRAEVAVETVGPPPEVARPPGVFERRFDAVGLVAASLFFALSLFPSLLPRAEWIQGVVSGVTLVVGYGLGSGVASLWRYLGVPKAPPQVSRVLVGVSTGLVLVFLAVSVWRYVGWQNDVRSIFGQDPISPTAWPVMIVVTAAVAGALLVVARSIRLLFRTVISRVSRRMPRRVAVVLGAGGLTLLIWLLVTGVGVNAFFAAANAAFSPRDTATNPGVEQPTAMERSGSPQSLATWDTLGRQGRSFVATGPARAELQAHGGAGKTPIRVYVGLKSAATVQARADMLLAELRRTGAFDRKILVIATTTGTGFLDPAAVDPLEYLWHGDSAIAGVQYSYLPSWLSLLADQEAVRETSMVVFKTVHAYWESLPAGSRPALYLYGLSLGSFGVESVLTSIDLVNEPIDGAFMVGPPFVNPLHNELEAKREPASMPWRPVYDSGRTVRFTAQEPVLEQLPGRWGPTRVAYLQHGSDPVVFFSQDLAFDHPAWLEDGQRAPDVSPRFVWVPLVTMWQVALDLPSAGNVPWGFAHLYPPRENLQGWAAVTRPPGWSDSELKELGTYLDQTVTQS